MRNITFIILLLFSPFFMNGQVFVASIEASPIIGTNDLNIKINSYCSNVHSLDNHEYTNNASDYNVNVCFFNTVLLMPTNITNNIVLLNANNPGTQNITINTYYKHSIEPVSTCSNLINVYYLSFEGPLTESRIFTLANDTFEQKKVSLYPNPNKGTFSIDLPVKLNNVSLFIYDVTGKKIFEVVNYSSGTPILINDISKGLYFINISTEQTSEILKFVVH